MGKYKHYILFIILVTIGFSAFYSVSAGNYPIALAGGELVFARDFWKNYNGASTYSQKMASIVSSSSRQISESELQVVVLDQLIEDKLVKKELKSQTKSDFGNLVDQKIARYSGDKDLEQAASMLYGMELSDFEELFLIPQAEREILKSRLFLQGTKFEDWVEDARRNARVFILSTKFQWKDGRVQAK